MEEATLKLIAHRGNLNGRNSEKENSPDYIDQAIHLGFDVEVDVWGQEGQFGLWLGHDQPTYPIDFQFLEKRIQFLWVHCKNAQSLNLVRTYLPQIRYFFHQTDDYTLTSWHDLWCYPGKYPVGLFSIIVMPEVWVDLEKIYAFCKQYHVAGVCSDYVRKVKGTSV